MSPGLRNLAQTASRALLRNTNAAEYQQQRMAGNLPVKPNKYVEAWSTNREHIELTYKWDKDTVLSLVKWVVAFPVVLYTITKWEYAKSDRMFGREERKFL